jgi:hypothetical protein
VVRQYLPTAKTWAAWRPSRRRSRTGDWLLQGYSHLSLGRASLALGRHRRARQQLAEAGCILRVLGIPITDQRPGF